MKQLLFSVFVFLVFLGEINAQTNIFTLRNYTETTKESNKFKSNFVSNTFEGSSYSYYKFSHIPSETELEEAKSHGVKFLEYIPHNIYLLSVPASEAGMKYLQNANIILSSIQFEKQKFSDIFLSKFDLYNASSAAKINCYVYCYDDIEQHKFERIVSSFGEINNSNKVFHRVTLTIHPGLLNALSLHPAIKIIDLIPPTPVADNLPGKTNHRSNVIGSGFGRNLQGDSVILGEWDGEGAGTHIDIDTPRVRRMNPYVNNSNGAHATHVCGTMAGQGIIDPFALGMAPNAKVYSWNFYGDITAQMDSTARYYNMTITQNSYGYGDPDDPCGATFRGKYDDVSRELDILVRNHPDLIHVFAAGNSQSQCGLGGYRTVFSGFQSAKNIISVGALTNLDAMSSFSSWGPVRDGRLKPEVCAVGVNVYPTQNANLYAGGWNGTSMACPGTSGTVAQLVQRYNQLHSGAQPEASLMRAILSNTADDILNLGPDFKSGFGRINALTAVKTIEQNRYKIDSVIHGAFKVDSIFISAGLQQLKVMLSWSDKEASALASKSLINDLDLYIITPINDTIRPWVLDTFNRNALAVRGIDSVNNIEQVTLDAPVQGYYKIYVKGRQVPFGPQIYAYTYEAVAKSITMIFPNGGEQLAPSKTYNIKWDAVGVGTTCTIEYSLNNGTSWTTMVSGIAVALKNYNWGVPNTSTSLARIRIIAGSYTDLTDTVFSILPIVDSIKGVVCDKQVTLKWKKITGVTGYDVMQVIGGTMKSVAITTDTFYTIKGLTNGIKYWFSVRGKYNNNYGERAIGVSFTPGISTIPPAITLQPVLPPVCSGTLVTLKSKAIGTASILQQWQMSIDTGKTFINIPLANDSVFSFVSNTLMNNLRFRCYFYNSCQNFQYSDTVTLNVDTVLVFLQQPQHVSVCTGADAQFYASAPSNSGTAYQWQFNDGINGWQNLVGENSELLSISNVPYGQNGWQYRVLVSNACTPLDSSNMVTLTVKAPLSIIATGNQTICWGQSATLGAIATGGEASKYVFEWSQNGVVLQRSHSPILVVNPIVPRTYKVVLWDSCSSIAVADSDSVTVNVLQPLAVTSNNYIPLCKGISTTLLAVGVGGNGNYTYGWLKGNTLVQYSQTNTLTITPNTTTTYRVFVTDSCTPRKDTATILVYVRDALKVVQQANPDTVCIGAQTTITAMGSGGDSSYVYTFINANTNLLIQTGTNPSLTTTVNSNNNFILVLSDSCTLLNDTLRFKIPMRSKLSATISKSPNSNVCSNTPVQLTANPLGGALKNYTYQWRKSGSATIIGTTKQITITTPVTTRYTVSIGDGCTATNGLDSIMVNIETPNPIFTSTYNNGNDFAYFKAVQSGYKKYFWDFGDGDTTSEFQPNHQYKSKGSYNVCLKISTFSGCDSDYCDSVHIYFNNGIRGAQRNLFSYSPNPFDNEINLIFADELPIQIKMYDAVGKELEFTSPIYKNTLLNTAELAAGNYILQLIYKDEVSYVKMIKR